MCQLASEETYVVLVNLSPVKSLVSVRVPLLPFHDEPLTSDFFKCTREKLHRVRYTEFYKIEKEAQLGHITGADALTTGSLCILLAKSRSGFKKTDSLISILILFTINTGLLTMYYIIWPHNFIFMGIYFVLGTVYYNSLLASLNARPTFRAKLDICTSPLQLPDMQTDLSLNSTEPYLLRAKRVMV
ncbi:hypothetical protein BDQ17DRAFT_1368618 [Cyathus striatus]|nr:hypothetical protein BDQ17DRAFT_1368618 [Cyathus striatus]